MNERKHNPPEAEHPTNTCDDILEARQDAIAARTLRTIKHLRGLMIQATIAFPAIFPEILSEFNKELTNMGIGVDIPLPTTLEEIAPIGIRLATLSLLLINFSHSIDTSVTDSEKVAKFDKVVQEIEQSNTNAYSPEI